MHDQSMKAMVDFFVTKWKTNIEYKFDILDVGSLRVGRQGAYKDNLPKHWNYTGLDLVAGPNVDIVPDTPYEYPFSPGKFDIVISGQAVEHVEDIFRWSAELYRVLKPGGQICIIGPSTGLIHHRPDYWRILPDGMVALLHSAGFKDIVLTTYSDPKWHTIRAVATKVMI